MSNVDRLVQIMNNAEKIVLDKQNQECNDRCINNTGYSTEVPKKYNKVGSAAFTDKVEANEVAKYLSEETGIKHTVQIDDSLGVAVIIPEKIESKDNTCIASLTKKYRSDGSIVVGDRKLRHLLYTAVNITHANRNFREISDIVTIKKSEINSDNISETLEKIENEHNTKYDAVYISRRDDDYATFILFEQKFIDFCGEQLNIGDTIYDTYNDVYRIQKYIRGVDTHCYNGDTFAKSYFWKLSSCKLNDDLTYDEEECINYGFYPKCMKKILWKNKEAKKLNKKIKSIDKDALPHIIGEVIYKLWVDFLNGDDNAVHSILSTILVLLLIMLCVYLHSL